MYTISTLRKNQVMQIVARWKQKAQTNTQKMNEKKM